MRLSFEIGDKRVEVGVRVARERHVSPRHPRASPSFSRCPDEDRIGGKMAPSRDLISHRAGEAIHKRESTGNDARRGDVPEAIPTDVD